MYYAAALILLWQLHSSPQPLRHDRVDLHAELLDALQRSYASVDSILSLQLGSKQLQLAALQQTQVWKDGCNNAARMAACKCAVHGIITAKRATCGNQGEQGGL